MKKIFMALSLVFLSAGFCAQAVAININDDEDQLDANIRKPGMSVRKHYVTPEEAAFAAANNKEKKKVLTKEEAERMIAEQKAQKAREDSIRKAEIEALLKEDYTIVQYVEPDPEPYKWEDEVEIETPIDSLKPYFATTSITEGGDTQYLHKDINSSFKENDFYFYFNTTNGVPGPMHFVAHYYADDPVEFVRLKFRIDNFNYNYTPTNIQRTRDNKYFAENFDNEMNASDDARDLVAALGQCYYSNMVLVSDTGVSHRIFFTPEQLKHFRQTYELYRLMGGKM